MDGLAVPTYAGAQSLENDGGEIGLDDPLRLDDVERGVCVVMAGVSAPCHDQNRHVFELIDCRRKPGRFNCGVDGSRWNYGHLTTGNLLGAMLESLASLARARALIEEDWAAADLARLAE